MVTCIIPVNGLMLGAAVLGESLDLTVLASLALILTGVLLVRREGRKEAEKPRAGGEL